MADAYSWYETQRPGLGEGFLGSVEAAFGLISRTPSIGSVVHDSYRRVLVRRFPYAVFYELAGDTRHSVRSVSYLGSSPRTSILAGSTKWGGAFQRTLRRPPSSIQERLRVGMPMP